METWEASLQKSNFKTYLITLGSPKFEPTMPQNLMSADKQSLWREDKDPRTGFSAFKEGCHIRIIFKWLF